MINNGKSWIKNTVLIGRWAENNESVETIMFDDPRNNYQNDMLRRMRADRDYWVWLQAANICSAEAQFRGAHHMANMSHANSPYNILSNALSFC